MEPLPLVNCDSADEESQECGACFKGREAHHKTIYTRPKENGEENDLW